MLWHMKRTLLRLKYAMSLPPMRLGMLLIPPALACFTLAPQARADCLQGCNLTRFNTFLGADALLNNTTGTGNTATGAGALTSNTTGFSNTATGQLTLTYNTTGTGNTAIGSASLNANTTGNYNTAVAALGANTTGNNNTGVGLVALGGNSTGSNNTALGYYAGANITKGNGNIGVGYQGGMYSDGDNNIDIGNVGGVESGVMRIGTNGVQTTTFVAGIRGVAIAGAQPVAVSASGQLGIRASSARFKQAIKSMDKSSEAILALHPVEFRYKKELDPNGALQFGLIAEDVAKVNPSLVVPDDQGKPFSVRYEEINTMLLNEFLKEHRKVEEEVRQNKAQEQTISELKAALAQEQKNIKVLTAGLQKVSNELELTKSAARVVNNN
jgi:trimeric autotransporter adhesin